jgi:hypothetical protein
MTSKPLNTVQRGKKEETTKKREREKRKGLHGPRHGSSQLHSNAARNSHPGMVVVRLSLIIEVVLLLTACRICPLVPWFQHLSSRQPSYRLVVSAESKGSREDGCFKPDPTSLRMWGKGCAASWHQRAIMNSVIDQSVAAICARCYTIMDSGSELSGDGEAAVIR